MLHLIPQVKTLDILNGQLGKKAVYCQDVAVDKRVLAQLKKLPQDAAGAKVSFVVKGDAGEGYELWIDTDAIRIEADSQAGAFYAVQTLRQIFTHDDIPCLHIKDEPDFAYRGFYQDETRGRVHTLETLKKLIDNIAYLKYNSLQLYVEFTCECEEYKDVAAQLGYLTNAELQELDAYCQENFIDFIPSLATFGHLYHLLHQEKYRHLCVLRDEEDGPNFYLGRHAHHTIDPLVPESIEVIRHLIDQYGANFTSDYFNICCDETFDLKKLAEQGHDAGKLYVDFVKQIISHVNDKHKKVMMWADVLLEHPEVIAEIPTDTVFLNWDYSADVNEEKIAKLTNVKQIVCPGTSTWWRFCEQPTVSTQNISRMAKYGKKHGALGLLNTNWGDYANMATIELAMYGVAVGAQKAWSVDAPLDDTFNAAVDHLIYEKVGAVSLLMELSALNDKIYWPHVCTSWFLWRDAEGKGIPACKGILDDVQQGYRVLAEKLAAKTWKNDEYRQDMLVAAEGICLSEELFEKLNGHEINRVTDAHTWLAKFRERWLATTKPSELFLLEEMLTTLNDNL